MLDLDHWMIGSVFVRCGFAALAEVKVADSTFISHSFYVGQRAYTASYSLMDTIVLVAFRMLVYL